MKKKSTQLTLRPSLLQTLPRQFILLLLLFLWSGKSALVAQWSTNPAVNNAICTADNEQNLPQIISDGAGGAIITWYDKRNGSDYDVYAQRIDASGTVQWAADGIVVSNAAFGQNGPRIISDGSGGAIIVWVDTRSGLPPPDIYAQRIDASGAALWTANGVPVCTAVKGQVDPMIVTDGIGGAIISWQDRRTAGGGVMGGIPDVYAQRVNAYGSMLWTTNGVPICTQPDEQSEPALASDGVRGAIITWADARNGSDYDIYAQRVDSAGAVQWATDGIAVSAMADDQTFPECIPDGLGGAIITWSDRRNGTDFDVYAQKVSASGVMGWIASGASVCSATGDQEHLKIASDGSGGSIISWDDTRASASGDIYAQRIDAGGFTTWTPGGVVICAESSDQRLPDIVSDIAGGAIITWYDSRNGPPDIYAQRIDSFGAIQWTTDGEGVCTETHDQYSPVLISSGAGSAIVAWADLRQANSDIYAQKINADGTIGGSSRLRQQLLQKAMMSSLDITGAVWPNPGGEGFNLVIGNGENGKPVSVRILDSYGKVIALYQKVQANSTLKIESGKWAAGIYYAEIIQNGQRKLMKMVRRN